MLSGSKPHSIRNLFARGRAALAHIRAKPKSTSPHFVRDYGLFAEKLVRTHGERRAMEVGVGGEFDAIGKMELALLRHLGLQAGHYIIDIGCGSGRLATALSAVPGIHYHGTDVVERFLAHARANSPPQFRFTLVDGLTIPDSDSVADLVTMFSVVTHLHHFESYLYLEEARRVLKPGGRVVVSFLEILNPLHWKVFGDTVEAARFGGLEHLNAFIEVPVIHEWSSRLGLSVDQVFRAGTPYIPLDRPIKLESGQVVEGLADLGQSVAVLRKP